MGLLTFGSNEHLQAQFMRADDIYSLNIRNNTVENFFEPPWAISVFSDDENEKKTYTTKQREKSMSNANRTMFKKMSTENRWHFECFCNENRRHSNTHFFSIKDLNRLKKKKKRPTHIYVSPKTTVQTTITHRRRQLYPIPSYVIRLIITIFVGQAIIANDCINLNIKLTEHTIVTKAKRQRKIP